MGRQCLLLSLLAMASCTPSTPAPEQGVVVFDQDLQLVRGEHLDSAQREFKVDADATFAAFVQEDDCNVTVKLETSGAGMPVKFVAVDTSFLGESLEVAVLDALRGSRLVVRLENSREVDMPCRVRTRLVRFDAAGSNPRIEARVAALRAWTAGTRDGIALDELQRSGIRALGAAREFFVAAARIAPRSEDASLAAWVLAVRAWMRNTRSMELSDAAADATQAAVEFSALGQSRNALRSRMVRFAALTDIAMDRSATAPTAAEAVSEVEAMLPQLARDPGLSALERAHALNFLGIFDFNLGRFDEADEHYRAALEAFEALGNRRGKIYANSNLGVTAAEIGDFQVATKYFERVVADIDFAGDPGDRVIYLMNAARADTNAGFVDRAIERLQLARQLSAEAGGTRLEASLLHAMGRAYWARGDVNQAAIFFKEALRLRRQRPQEVSGLIATLRYSGIIERDLGRTAGAIQMHREAVNLSVSNDQRLRGLLDLANDYAAVPDYRRAIATCREALALPLSNAEFYKRYETQLALGEFLLDQPGAGAAAAAEAQALAGKPLDAAQRRADAGMEIAARRLLASSFAALGKRGEARTEYLRAINLIFRYSGASTNPELQAYTLAREQLTIRGYLDQLMSGATGRAPGVLRTAAPEEAEALGTIEWARASGISNAGAATLDAQSSAQVDALLAKMAGKRVRIAALLERPEDSMKEVERLQFDIANLRAEVDGLRAHSPSAIAETPAGRAPPLPPLPAGVAQWSFAFGNRRAYLWVRDSSGMRAAVLQASPVELQRQLAVLNANLHARAPEATQALEKFAFRMLPRDALPAGAQTLQIVADGSLSSLPFAALPGVRERAIVMISSEFGGSSMPVRPRPLRFLGVAGGAHAPANDAAVFPPLAATAREARSVAAIFERSGTRSGVKLLLGDDGSGAQLAQFWQRGVDVLHVATHALADLRQPMTSLLLLPAVDAQGQSTYLTAGQIQQWRGDADLVYLSACETAVGPARFADGMPGLQRAFLRAGARGVIATLWPVEDVYASQFAADFYRRYTAGEPAAAALTATQRAWAQPRPGLSADEQAHRRMTAWAHAYYTR